MMRPKHVPNTIKKIDITRNNGPKLKTVNLTATNKTKMHKVNKSPKDESHKKQNANSFIMVGSISHS